MSNRPRSRSTSDLWRNRRRAYQMEESVQDIRGQMLESLVFQETPDTSKEVLDAFLANLPKLTERELAAIGQADAPCPICLNPFSVILTEEEMALAMDTPAHPIEDLGVTRPGTCGHVFCMKELSAGISNASCIRNWVSQGKNTCPFCRATFPNLPALPTHSSTHDALVTALQQQMQALTNSGDRTPPQTVVPLTAEQMASLHEAIMLFQSGGAWDEELGQLQPWGTEQTDALLARMRDDGVATGSREGERREEEEEDRESFSSMYS